MHEWPLLILLGAVLLVVWLYITARVVSFGVLKSLFSYKWNMRRLTDGTHKDGTEDGTHKKSS